MLFLIENTSFFFTKDIKNLYDIEKSGCDIFVSKDIKNLDDIKEISVCFFW